jgi:hypothetical protein
MAVPISKAVRIGTMRVYWVRTEETYGFNESWHGPFDDETAERVAKRLSKPTGAEDKFAEVIRGQAGQKGKRVREFYLCEGYAPGESGWYEGVPDLEIQIPAQ